jgi:putative addiction module component (TIGR02574 family)
MNKALRDQVMQLPPEERAELAQEIWDSLPDDVLPTTREQLDEAERRLEEHRKDPASAIPWEDVREWLWSRRK